MFNNPWGGYLANDFLFKLDPKLGKLRDTLADTMYDVDAKAGDLTEQWDARLGKSQRSRGCSRVIRISANTLRSAEEYCPFFMKTACC